MLYCCPGFVAALGSVIDILLLDVLEKIAVIVFGAEYVELVIVTGDGKGIAAHVESPRQNVVDEAPVPPFKFETGKFPVMSDVERFIAEKVHTPPLT